MNEKTSQSSDEPETTRYLPELKADAPADGGEQTARVASTGATSVGQSDFADEQAIGEFKLIRRLGRGGMAEVWLAEQTSLKRPVALKLLRGELIEDQNYIKRFQREAMAAAGLAHPNIVAIYAVGEEKGQHFIAQEYIQGQTLRQVITKRGALDLPLALHMLRQTASALEAAGEKGIIHRDIKPDNIMVTKKGEVKVADFGLAQLVAGGGEALHLTQPGETMGTPLYMSPEQVRGDALDQRSDIYSLGVTSYHMLAGRPPFHGETAVSVAMQHLQSEPPPLSGIRDDLPKPVCDMVHRMMAKDPQQRYASATDVLNDVKALLRAVKAGDVDNVQLSKLAGPVNDKSFEVKHPAWALTLLCLLVAGISAGMGWALRAGDPLATPVPQDVLIPKAETARDQYLRAMFSGVEEEFLAVKEYWPQDREWVNRAEEQLTLILLRDASRREEAKEQIINLGSLGREDDQYRQLSRVADAWLLASGDESEKTRARSILSTLRPIEDQLNDTWRNLMREAENLLERGPMPQQGGFPPQGPPPGDRPQGQPPEQNPSTEGDGEPEGEVEQPAAEQSNEIDDF